MDIIETQSVLLFLLHFYDAESKTDTPGTQPVPPWGAAHAFASFAFSFAAKESFIREIRNMLQAKAFWIPPFAKIKYTIIEFIHCIVLRGRA